MLSRGNHHVESIQPEPVIVSKADAPSELLRSQTSLNSPASYTMFMNLLTDTRARADSYSAPAGLELVVQDCRSFTDTGAMGFVPSIRLHIRGLD